MNLLPPASLLVLAAAMAGYAYLFQKRQRQRLQRLHEADARETAAPYVSRRITFAGRHRKRSRRASGIRKAFPVPRSTRPWQFSGWAASIIAQLVWVLVFTVLIGIGIIVPGAGALRLFHSVGLLTQYPLTPEGLLEVARYALWAAVGLVMLGMLGLSRYGLFLAVFLAGLFACSFISAIVFSSLITMPVHLVVSPLFGIDAWHEWRPFVHLAFVLLGVPWAFSICYNARRDLLYDGPDAGYGGYRFSGNPGTAVSAGGALFGGLFDGSSGADGSWSDDSGGDSD